MSANDRYVNNLELFLLKVQADNATKQSTLLAADYADVLEGSVHDFEPEVETPKFASGSFDQAATVVGKQGASATLRYPLRSHGDGNTPDFFAALECADFTIDNTLDYFRAKPSSGGGKSGTLWGYEGKQGTTNVHKISNWKPNWKITGSSGQMVTIEFVGNCAHDNYESATAPTVTKVRTKIPAFINATVLINNFAYKVLEFEIDGGQTHDLTNDPTAANGCGQNIMTDREIQMTAKVYMQNAGTVNPIAALKAGTEGAVELYWGPDDQIKVDAAYSQIIDAKRSDQNGVKCWDLTLKLNRNDFALLVLGFDGTTGE